MRNPISDDHRAIQNVCRLMQYVTCVMIYVPYIMQCVLYALRYAMSIYFHIYMKMYECVCACVCAYIHIYVCTCLAVSLILFSDIRKLCLFNTHFLTNRNALSDDLTRCSVVKPRSCIYLRPHLSLAIRSHIYNGYPLY